jgi:hypothetical protein
VRIKGKCLVVHEYDIPEPSPSPVKFRDLAIGDRFDFVGPEWRFNSFYATCTKTSARKYSWDGAEGQILTTRVGCQNVRVYHVERS